MARAARQPPDRLRGARHDGAVKTADPQGAAGHQKTGMSKEVSFFTQRIFDKGHAVEDLARVIVEGMLGEDLFPIVGSLGKYLASMDGANLMGDTLFEHKQWNEELAAAVRAKELDAQY